VARVCSLAAALVYVSVGHAEPPPLRTLAALRKRAPIVMGGLLTVHCAAAEAAAEAGEEAGAPLGGRQRPLTGAAPPQAAARTAAAAAVSRRVVAWVGSLWCLRCCCVHGASMVHGGSIQAVLPLAAASMPIDAPCAQCLRHGDPIHASQGRRCCLPAASMPPSCVRGRWPPSWLLTPVRELLLIVNLA
jgi:hypothetical protein